MSDHDLLGDLANVLNACIPRCANCDRVATMECDDTNHCVDHAPPFSTRVFQWEAIRRLIKAGVLR